MMQTRRQIERTTAQLRAEVEALSTELRDIEELRNHLHTRAQMMDDFGECYYPNADSQTRWRCIPQAALRGAQAQRGLADINIRQGLGFLMFGKVINNLPATPQACGDPALGSRHVWDRSAAAQWRLATGRALQHERCCCCCCCGGGGGCESERGGGSERLVKPL